MSFSGGFKFTFNGKFTPVSAEVWFDYLCCELGLAYCRHLSTVRTHLSALVNYTIVAPDVPCDAYKGVTTDVWTMFLQDCTVSMSQSICFTHTAAADMSSHYIHMSHVSLIHTCPVLIVQLSLIVS